MWWIWLLISVTGYVAGFIVSGAIYSYTFSASPDRADLVVSMLLWPVILPCHGLYKAALVYINFLEENRVKRIRKLSGNVVPVVVPRAAGWETHE